jgi:NAD(P)-dependent dehydrogenase (short-subunit alcohol dehydrogenase family)
MAANPVAVIAGASSGIGYELAKQCIRAASQDGRTGLGGALLSRFGTMSGIAG